VGELEKYSPELAAKPRWLVLNKLDLIPKDEQERRVADFLRAYGASGEAPCFRISAIDGGGCRPLVFALWEALDALEPPTPVDDPVSAFFPDDTPSADREQRS
jgi:GTP-binding protein